MTTKQNVKKTKLRNAEYYNQQDIFDKLYSESKDGKIFDKLMALIISEDNIILAYRNIKKNSGSNTAGIDGKTISDLANMDKDEFVYMIQNKLQWYTPKAVRRVEIPKQNGKMRPLGIPCITDRIIQQCILQVLEPICEAKFYQHSYGFRPNRSAENAISRAQNLMQLTKLHYVVDVDIKGFFDNVNHNKLIRQMWTLGIRDKKLLCIVKQMLKAPIVMPNGELINPVKGTPQGGILSPLLANIVLNELDWWIASQWENFPARNNYAVYENRNGTLNKGHIYGALKKNSNLKEVYIVRYADDFKLFTRTYQEANRIYHSVVKWLDRRLKLEVNMEKSGVTNLKRNYTEFLGFDLKVRPKSHRLVVTSKITKKAMARMKMQLENQIKNIQRPANSEVKCSEIAKFNSMVIGMHNYYRIATSTQLNFDKIAWELKHQINNRLNAKKNGKRDKNNIVIKRYGKSKQLRFVEDMPMVPIGYIQTKHAMSYSPKINEYTKEGRLQIHKNLQVDMSVIYQLMYSSYKGDYSIEYYDNRISLYAAQYGKCALTGIVLDADEVHCHHKIPKRKNGTDEYNNLIIVHKEIHKLLHMSEENFIKETVWKSKVVNVSKLYQLRAMCK